jgi:hypothetical protein
VIDVMPTKLKTIGASVVGHQDALTSGRVPRAEYAQIGDRATWQDLV